MSKRIEFRVSNSLWEKFYRLFPGTGERSEYLRACIKLALELGPEHKFIAKVRERIEMRKDC